MRATDPAGNIDPTPAGRSWTIQPPAETDAARHHHHGRPARPGEDHELASFSFSADEPGSSFECSLDGAPYVACASPAEYTGLADGAHTFAVRATDPAGNTDPTPATRSWTVDTAAPNTTITSAPPATTQSTSASFAFSATEAGSTFECSLDGAPFAACSSPRDYTGLSNGAHTFAVRATDPAGNSDPTPATHAWTIDTVPPQTSIDSGPSALTSSTSAGFAFTATEAGSSFECSLDAAPFAACTSPRDYTGLAQGAHTFRVRATDPAGNTDATPATYSWTIDTARRRRASTRARPR